LSGGIWRCLCEAFFLVVVINGSGGDLACAIDLSDDRISGLKAVAVTMIWSCRARVAVRGSRCGSRRWLSGAVVTLSLVDSRVSDVALRPCFMFPVCLLAGLCNFGLGPS
ncbi:unnamed protein product, partial [Brassica rapa]